MYYIGERVNPQLKKSYFNTYGKLTKKEANKKENTLYGPMYMISFRTKKEYEDKINKLKNDGFTVNSY